MESSLASSPPAAWKVLRTEYVIKRPWLTVRQDCVRLPTGAVIEDYYVLEYPAWVNVVAVTGDDQLVMVRQYRHGLGAVHYELPAGGVESSDATPLAAAKRELLEETGFGGGQWSPLLTSSANPSTHSNLTHSFLASGVERIAEATPDASEDVQTCILNLSDVRCLVESGKVVQAMQLAPLLLYFLGRSSAPT